MFASFVNCLCGLGFSFWIITLIDADAIYVAGFPLVALWGGLFVSTWVRQVEAEEKVRQQRVEALRANAKQATFSVANNVLNSRKKISLQAQG